MSSSSHPRPITVRFPTEDLDRLLAVSQLTGLSTSQLLREGAGLVVQRHLEGYDNPEKLIEAAAEKAAERMRAILGSPKAGMAYEAALEAISYVIASLSRLLADETLESADEDQITSELRDAVKLRRSLDPSDLTMVDETRRHFEARASELRNERLSARAENVG